MDKKIIKQRFNLIAIHFKHGDAVLLSEMTQKSQSICRSIIRGTREPQPWFILAAEKYLEAIGRIETKRKLKITPKTLREFSQRRDSLQYGESHNKRESNSRITKHYERLEGARHKTLLSDDHDEHEDQPSPRG